MSDITTCPKCQADLSVSDAPGDTLVCARCGYTTTKPRMLPAGERDLDVSTGRGWDKRTVVYIAILLAVAITVPICFMAGCTAAFN
jgi:ribosomal protein S27AE